MSLKKAFGGLVSAHSSANFVVFIWIASIVLPFLVVYVPEDGPGIVNVIGMVVLAAATLGHRAIINAKVSAGQWAKSDAVVYVVVPLALFSFVSVMIVTG